MKKTIISILALAFLAQASIATAITDWNFFAKEVIADTLARGIQRGIMTALNDNITGLVLESDKTQSAAGRPGYVQNWRSYLGEGRFQGENIFRYEYGQTGTCGYFRDELGALFGASGESGDVMPIDTKAAIARIHPYELTSRCTLTTVTGPGRRESNPDSKEGDKLIDDIWFNSNDAWGSFAELSRPQNNFYGAYNMAVSEFLAQSEYQKEVSFRETVDGFKPIKWVDEDYDFFNPDSPGCATDIEGRCIASGDIGTPAGVRAGVTLKIFETEFDLLANADDIEDFIAVISAGLITKLGNFGNGDSIEFNVVRSKPDHRDFFNAQACINECNDKVFGGSTAECLAAMTGIIADRLAAVEAAAGSSGNSSSDSDDDSNITPTIDDTILLQIDGVSDLDQQASDVCVGDSSEIRFAKCQVFCMNYLYGAELNPDGGRCGVNYPQPECFCAETDSTTSYNYPSTVIGIQNSVVSQACAAGTDIGVICDDRGPHGLGRLVGGLNPSAATKYMDALIAAINTGTNLQASYHFVGDEPILGVFDGERTEYYDVITSSGNVWNNGGKVICTPSSPAVN